MQQRFLPGLGAALWLAVGLLGACQSPGECLVDAQCGPDRVCRVGVCVSLCNNDLDCSGRQKCQDGVCFPAVEVSPDAGALPPDGSVVVNADAGGPLPDASVVVNADAGGPLPDGSVVVNADAGVADAGVEKDAGPARDAGPRTDAGFRADAGSVAAADGGALLTGARHPQGLVGGAGEMGNGPYRLRGYLVPPAAVTAGGPYTLRLAPVRLGGGGR